MVQLKNFLWENYSWKLLAWAVNSWSIYDIYLRFLYLHWCFHFLNLISICSYFYVLILLDCFLACMLEHLLSNSNFTYLYLPWGFVNDRGMLRENAFHIAISHWFVHVKGEQSNMSYTNLPCLLNLKTDEPVSAKSGVNCACILFRTFGWVECHEHCDN